MWWFFGIYSDFMLSKQVENTSKSPVASEKVVSSSKKVKSEDDDFMPSKRAQNRFKSRANSKSGRSSKSVASLKGADADYDFVDEFVQGKLVQITLEEPCH